MSFFPKKLTQKIEKRKAANALRKLPIQNNLIDFSSNDYLGFSKQIVIQENRAKILEQNSCDNGATGSRLLSGNHPLHEKLEAHLASWYNKEGALLFNSGYDANIGFFSCLPQRGDIIFYDELVHASIRDGIKMSNAKSYKFTHNNITDLQSKIALFRKNKSINDHTEYYVVTESVFSMNGDSPDLKAMVALCEKAKAYLVVDEAHAVGVYNKGLLNVLGIESKVFAQIITFGKGMGCHGAAVLGSHQLKNYLINFSRSFIYTTAMGPDGVATILAAYMYLNTDQGQEKIYKLKSNISYFKSLLKELRIEELFLHSNSALQIAMVTGNNRVKQLSQKLATQGFNVLPVLSPTVSEGKERLRICLHAYNSQAEIYKLLSVLKEIDG